MYRFIILALAFVVSMTTSGVAFGQEAASDAPAPAFPTSTATGPLNCFDYYTFGSVQADLQPTVVSTVPGALMTFTGEIKSENPYPLLDGTLYVKIFRRDETTFASGDGNEVVDQFVVQEGITVPAQGAVPVEYEWKVPQQAEGGEYYAAYFFTTAKRYNLMGLSFTDDVVGNQAPFTITADNSVTKLSKIDTTLNGENHHFAAFPLHFEANEPVVVKTTITNSSNMPKTVPLQWNQYAWDAMNQDNLRFTKTELVTVLPGEVKEVTYTAQPQRESVTYVTAVTQDNEVKSILNIRYVRDGIEETRINFPGLTAFPLEKDNEQTLFACAHSTNLPVVPGNTLTLTLADKDGTVIHEYTYEGDIAGAMGGFGESFTPTKNINYATLTATLQRDGVIVEEVTQTYDCAALDESTCLPEEVPSFIDFLTSNLMNIILTLSALILVSVAAIHLYKRRRININGMTNPSAFLFLVLLLPSMFFITADQVEAKSDIKTGSVRELFEVDNGTFVEFEATYQVTYYADIINADTGALIQDGSTIPLNTRVKFVPKQRARTGSATSDIYWSFLGEVMGTPFGYWDGPNNFCAGQDDIGSGLNAMAESISVFSPYSVKIVPEIITPSGVSLVDEGGGVYRVTSAGVLSVNFHFPEVVGNDAYFAVSYEAQDRPRDCARARTLLAPVAAADINFSINVTDPGAAPATPTISGPTMGRINTPYDFTISGTDPDGDQVRYGLTNAVCNASAYQWLPGSGYVNSGTSQTLTGRSWSSAGTYTIYAFTQDSNSGISSCASHQIIITNGGGASCTAAPVENVNPSTNALVFPSDSACYAMGYTVDVTSEYSGPGGYDNWVNATDMGSNNGQCAEVKNGSPYTLLRVYEAPRCNVAPTSCTPIGSIYLWNGRNWDDYSDPVDNAWLRFINLDTTTPPSASWLPAPVSNPRQLGHGIVFYGSRDPITGRIGGALRCDGGVSGVTATDLKINNSDGPLSVNKQDEMTITWSATNVTLTQCTLMGAGIPGGAMQVGRTGNMTVTASLSDTYALSCGSGTGESDTVALTVTDRNPVMDSVTYTSGTRQTGQPVTFTVLGHDDDGDQMYYEFSWDGDDTPDGSPTQTVDSGTAQPATYTWNTTGPHTFKVRVAQSPAAVGGSPSAWMSHTVTIDPGPPAIVTLEASTDNTNWNSGNATVDATGALALRWTSENAATCTATAGSGFNTGNATDGTDTNVTPPAAGSSATYTVDCAGVTASLTLTGGLPNFTQPNVSCTPSAGYDPMTGEYDSVTVTSQTMNNGQSGTANNANASYQMQFDSRAAVTGNIPQLARGATTPNFSKIFNDVPFGAHSVLVQIDNTNAVTESNETDNSRDHSCGAALPPPDPQISCTADRTQVRNDETTTIRWDTVATYPGLSCRVYGPGMDVNPAGLNGSQPTQPITAKSVYTCECTESTTNTTWTETAIVETQGVIEEI